jgi:RNA polymerase sigma-70 factor, ECF subfamily
MTPVRVAPADFLPASRSEASVPPERGSGFFRVATRPTDPQAIDDRLVAGLLADEPEAWREFHHRFDRLIRRCITKVTRHFGAVVTSADVEEIRSIFSLSLLSNDKHKLKSYDPDRGNRLGSWIGLLAVNAAYDYLRGRRREAAAATLDEALDLASEEPDPFDVAADRELEDVVSRALEGFSERDREFAALYFAEGVDPARIAERLNISIKTVYSKRHKIQARLLSALRDGTGR